MCYQWARNTSWKWSTGLTSVGVAVSDAVSILLARQATFLSFPFQLPTCAKDTNVTIDVSLCSNKFATSNRKAFEGGLKSKTNKQPHRSFSRRRLLIESSSFFFVANEMYLFHTGHIAAVHVHEAHRTISWEALFPRRSASTSHVCPVLERQLLWNAPPKSNCRPEHMMMIVSLLFAHFKRSWSLGHVYHNEKRNHVVSTWLRIVFRLYLAKPLTRPFMLWDSIGLKITTKMCVRSRLC